MCPISPLGRYAQPARGNGPYGHGMGCTGLTARLQRSAFASVSDDMHKLNATLTHSVSPRERQATVVPCDLMIRARVLLACAVPCHCAVWVARSGDPHGGARHAPMSLPTVVLVAQQPRASGGTVALADNNQPSHINLMHSRSHSVPGRQWTRLDRGRTPRRHEWTGSG